MTAFFDSSAVIALADDEHVQHTWSFGQLTSRKADGPIIINDIVYAEASVGMGSRAAMDAVIARYGLQRAQRDDNALYDAGQRYKHYKDVNQGPKLNVLPDFFIGAAARSLGIPLVTANPKDFKKYFKGLLIVHPAGEETVV